MKYFSLLLYVLFSINLKAQDTFRDPRDGNEYKTVSINNTVWFVDNLKFETATSHCPSHGNSDGDCESGNFYTYQESRDVCPAGWALPELSDWEELVAVMSADITMHKYNFKKQYRVDLMNANLYELDYIKVRPLGRVEGDRFLKGSIIDFWTIDPDKDDLKYHMHITPTTISGHRHKHHLDDKPENIRKFPIRCVKPMTDKIL